MYIAGYYMILYLAIPHSGGWKQLATNYISYSFYHFDHYTFHGWIFL